MLENPTPGRAAKIPPTWKGERRPLVEWGLALPATAVIGNGVEEPAPFAMTQVSNDVRTLCASGFDVLCFGRINWKKGLDRVIRSLTSMPAATLVVAGNDEDGYVSKLKALGAALGVQDRVSFLPRQIGGADKE